MNEFNSYSTENLHEKLLHCDELVAFHEFLSQLPNDISVWKEKINGIIQDNQYTKTKFAELCEVSRTAVAKWCDGSIPSGRDDFIKIGFAANYNLDEMNKFLKRYGKYPALYAKSLEDNVYIFVLNSKSLPHTYEFCKEIMNNIKSIMQESQHSIQDTHMYVNGDNTVNLNSKLLSIDSVDVLLEFVRENAAMYQSAYEKLYAYINAFIELNNRDFVTGKLYSVDFLAQSQGWSASFYKCISAIRQKKWFPMRRKVIALGLHLNMTTDQINEMLRLAQMETLCPKNIVESAIIYAVEDADISGLICCDGGNELCEHVRKVLESLNIPDAEKLLNDI